MALVLGDDERMLKDSAEGFFADESPVAALRRMRDQQRPEGFDPTLWQRMGAMGFAGVVVPEAHGGAGLGMVAAALIAEAGGAHLAASPFLSTAVVAARLLAECGTQAQQARWLPSVARGEAVMALAADEARRHDPALVRTRAEPWGNGWRLSGAKTHVVDGPAADRLIVVARVDGADAEETGLALFLLDPQAPGVVLGPRTTVDSRRVAEVRLDGVEVTGDDLLGEAGAAWRPLAAALDAGRVCLAAEMVGAAGRGFAITLDYLGQRRQFGQPIGSFQALQHRAAHLFCEMELARSTVLRAARALDAGEPRAPFFASLAKAKSGQVARLAANEAVQMHGGIGMTDEHDIGFYLKRVRAAAETFGDSPFHGARLAAMLGI